MIDGLTAVDAAYRLAGMVGVSPRGWSCGELWQMAQGRLQLMRDQVLAQANLVWRQDELDVFAFLKTGSLAKFDTQAIHDPELARMVGEELKKIEQAKANKNGNIS